MNLLWGVLAPFTGALADKFGLKRVAIVGALFYSGGILILSNSASPQRINAWRNNYRIWTIRIGLYSNSRCSWKSAPPEKRGTALGLTTMGGSIGMFLGVPVTGTFIQSFGWSGALFGLAAISLVMIPLVYGLVQNDKITDQKNQTNDAGERLSEVLSHALKSKNFLLLVCGFFICGFHEFHRCSSACFYFRYVTTGECGYDFARFDWFCKYFWCSISWSLR